VSPMHRSVPLRLGVALLACSSLSACSGGDEGVLGDGGDCTSHYELVASAGTWAGLKEAMLANEDWGRVASLRTQARGEEADSGPGHEKVVRVMDLLDGKGRRLIQVDVWRTGEGWRAGAWSQCID
jgi:hypothetical protein